MVGSDAAVFVRPIGPMASAQSLCQLLCISAEAVIGACGRGYAVGVPRWVAMADGSLMLSVPAVGVSLFRRRGRAERVLTLLVRFTTALVSTHRCPENAFPKFMVAGVEARFLALFAQQGTVGIWLKMSPKRLRTSQRRLKVSLKAHASLKAQVPCGSVSACA